MTTLNFIFTKDDFYPEMIQRDGAELSEWEKTLQADRHRALYQMGFQERP